MRELIVKENPLCYVIKGEMIRCKDCHWHYGSVCRKTNTTPWEDEDFCSKAEREEYETD